MPWETISQEGNMVPPPIPGTLLDFDAFSLSGVGGNSTFPGFSKGF